MTQITDNIIDQGSTMSDNIIDRDELQDKYIQRVIDSLDLDDCLAMLYDYIDKDTDKLTLNELIEDVEEYYPELLIDEPSESTGWN